MSNEVIIRDAKPEDTNLIYATWLRGLFYGESWFTIIPKNIFMSHYHKVVEYILNKPTITVKIACLKDNENAILGYSVYENDVLHWVFCKTKERRKGIAKALVPSNIKTVTHLTKIGLGIIRNKSIDFNPFFT